MLGYGDRHVIDFLHFKEFPIVSLQGGVAAYFRDPVLKVLGASLVDVADARDFDVGFIRHAQESLQMRGSNVATANEGDVEAIVGTGNTAI